MPGSSADDIIDRRALRRKLAFWRVAAILVAGVAIVAAGLAAGDGLGLGQGDHIARIPVSGTILNDAARIKRIADAADNERVKAIIIAVDSPGGTTVGGESLHEAIIKAKAKKPVVAEVSTLAASAGYMIASATDHIVARESSIVGSIGVLVQMPNISTLMGRVGISVDEVKSSPLKAEPNFLNPTTPEELAMMERMIRDSYDWFVDLVIENRKMTRAQVTALADGSVFTGRQAKANGLIDSLGGEDAVLAYLKTRNIDTELDIIDIRPPAAEPLGLFGRLAGIDQSAFDRMLQASGLGGVFLDGLVSVWQGPIRNPNGGSGQK
ncbi:MAG: signal peptide peptidase SppA [Rhizobiaceae bacterium]|jgi:protease-4|nr:signal peptide peptidase SppA [Rhizobiaceae bacterium]